MRPARARGFTLIEMMAVVAVIAILALIALPSMLDRLSRQQIAEALPLAELAKPAVQAAWAQGKPLPPDNESAGIPPADKIVNAMVSQVRLENGAIHIRFGNKANGSLQGKTLTLRPAVVEDTPAVPIAWLCGKESAPDKMTALGSDRTDVPLNLLPLRCRR